jgi:hypothetical protein
MRKLQEEGFSKAFETVDLIFSEGIDWQAFLASFQKLQVVRFDSA